MTYRARVETLYLLGFSLDLVNMFIGTVAYPSIATDLQASVPQLAWIGNAYMLGLTLVIPLGSWLAARLGERRLLCVSLALFTLGAVLAGTAPSIAWLIGWRLLQGLGGGLLIPVGQAMAYRECPPADRARLTARIMAVALLVPALSPTLGGVLVEWGSWRGVLLVSVPLAVVGLVLAACWVRPGAPLSASALDRRGLLLGSMGLSVLLVALSLIAEPGQRRVGAGLLVAAAVVLFLYARSARRTEHPVLQWSLLRHPSLRVAMLVYLLVPGTFIGTQLVATLLLHRQGYGAAAIGGFMVPWAIASACAIATTRHWLPRIGARPLLSFGMGCQALGIALLIGVQAGHPWLPVLAFALMGLGGSLCSSSAQTLAFQGLADAELLPGSALWNLNRQLSFCLAAALLACVLALLSAVLPAQAFTLTLVLAAGMSLLPILLLWRLPASSLSLRTSP
ncbi:MFS transporter [Stenotrophomonas sp. JAI102]|uniref:MFS transporter n=1 Tax=Stenotrophomonas sp. JAI102 TaxID=2723077 RepID=UPI0015CB7195|nr:MFS transporter [Stenotrophomonas sp. JAI102]NYF34909.1 EmrB/QacA subfamily drug resistance transporter [Stenotrophomonas sp. JAI102]